MTTMIDSDPLETREWLDALADLAEIAGKPRAAYLLERIEEYAQAQGISAQSSVANTPYINTISTNKQAAAPGDNEMEWRIRSLIRWNAAVMVIRANKKYKGIGGHIATFASAATLYDVGFNHFFKGPNHPDGSDLLFIQGHSAPGIYARAFLEGRLSEKQLNGFRFEISKQGLPSYPHPKLMPDFWQFPTVSMGLSSIMGIYQARFMHYLENRQLAECKGRRVWVFLGDGEMDEPESLGAISLAAREKLDNLTFVINCNLQRLDGPVRGNGKIIQELEAVFRGSGWNVIKVIWGSYWDPLLSKDKEGLLVKRMGEVIDGYYQNYKAKEGSYIRKHFFGKYPQLLEMVADLSDLDLWKLNRGGHDPNKVYAAYHEAVNHKGQPTVILAKTVKGYGMGESGEGQNKSHQQKKMDIDSLKMMRDRFKLPLTDKQVENLEYLGLSKDSEEYHYLHEHRTKLGGFMPQRSHLRKASPLPYPNLDSLSSLLKPASKAFSTTMAFVRILTLLCRDPQFGRYAVPIVPDEARTFGMEGMFRTLGIYSSVGQLYEPQDIDEIMYYKEDKSGQILEESICEAGAFSSWVAAATSYSEHSLNMVPFYIFYSIFGFQRIGDLAWAAGDMEARGFLIGATSGRTTLAGEGLQHQDGQSHLQAAVIPNCVSYDPCFAYELAVIIHHGLKRMVGKQENVFFYITVMNESYEHPEMPKDVAAGIIRGIYLLKASPKPQVRLLGSGAILRECIAARELLQSDWDIEAQIFSVTSFTELSRDGHEVVRWNRLHPHTNKRIPYVTLCLPQSDIPVIAASDYMHSYAEQIRAYIPAPYYTLGTDGYGRSDTREQLRRFFEVDRYHIALTALQALTENKKLSPYTLASAIQKYQIDPEAANPATC